MIKAGLIGLGKMGISHFSILNAHPDAEVTSVCDTSKFVLSAVQQYGQAHVYKDYKTMIKEAGLDCVVISTPTSAHAKMVRFALENGLHVFVEKPFCLSVEEGRELSALAKEKKRVNQVGFHFRFVGAFQKTQELLKSRILGDIYHFRAEAYGPVVLKTKGMTWRTKSSEGGGCLHDYASHVIDMVHYLLGHPNKVRGTILKTIYSKSVEDSVFSSLFYENGLTGQLSVNWSDESYRKMSTRMEIYGTRGKIIADRQECMVYLMKDPGIEGFVKGWNMLYTTELTKPVYFYLRGEEYSAQMDYFVQKVKTQDMDNINSFDSAIQTDEVLDCLIEDAK